MENFEELDDISEDEFEATISKEVDHAGKYFAEEDKKSWGTISESWAIASSIVNKVKPVPWIFWIMIKSVYGSMGKKSQPDPMTFVILENLLIMASQDVTLIKGASAEFQGKKTVTNVVKILGSETVGSLSFMHSVCMRTSRLLNDRIYRAIIDDALIRARLGVIVGQNSDFLDIGKPLLAGFAGRAGLAVQLASGSEDQAKKALNSLATGKDISKVGAEVYGCDPLQVAALTLVASGCNRNIAFGVATYSLPTNAASLPKEQELWFNMFSLLENLRQNKIDQISNDIWLSLGLDDVKKEDVLNQAQDVFRNGHGLAWLTTKLSEMV